MGETGDLLLALHALSEHDRERAGGKAATLGRLARAGLAVPEGVVLTTAAAARALEAAGLGGEPAPAEVLAAPLPADVEAALATAAARFDTATLAVRSSALAEDLPGASFAGQYESVLGVRGLDALRAAVRRCWASAHSERLRAYSSTHGQAGASPIAVLIQRQVDADIAGVAFSADPVSGARDRVLVSAIPGLGEALVSGAQSPDEWVVQGQTATAVRVTHQALTEAQALAVASLAKRVEDLLGGPQDIEWAMFGGRLLVLQARAMTAVPRPPEVDLPPGTWVKDSGRYPEPMTALGASVAAPLVADGLSSMWAGYGGLLDHIEVRTVGGEPYARVVPMGGRAGPPPPWWLLGVLARVAPPLRRRMRAARRMLRPGVLEGLVDRWYGVWRPEFQAAIAELRGVELSRLEDRELESHLGRVIELLRRTLHVHFHLIPPYVVPLHELVQVCAELLGWETTAALELMSGTSTASTEPAVALAALADRIRQSPAARAAVERADPDVVQRLAAADAELGAEFEAWCASYALRCVNDDPGSPVLAERPELLARLLANAVSASPDRAGTRGSDADAARQEAARRARAQLSGRSHADHDRFERALSAALRSYPVREDTAFWAASLPAGLLRLAAVEAGRRLVARGELAHPEDAVALDADTLRGALLVRPAGDLRALVARARAERAWTLQHPGPAFYGPPASPPPDVRGLPRAGRRLNAALLWVLAEESARPDTTAQPEAVLVGLPASPGRYTGPARIVRSETQFSDLRPGDVLVAPTTDPAWSVLFATAGALVTDGGGPLSHAAIVAREHGIPAVVGTALATQKLHDGELITVDGTGGRVIAEREPSLPVDAHRAGATTRSDGRGA